ncbi:glycosyltransferase family A protein [Pedobacter aquatilis]|uniref:glycosyltransferase family 2 protein n=1 Tax=Pedobacter aquatilis TaxID=351343 RepID=UPI00292D9DC3|nr:glycosyltransferase family A protein [Pedobacter aquatilis]
MDKNYKISVIICVYNEGISILKALKSLRNNKIYSATEIILVDDCSTDNSTLQVLAKLNQVKNLQIIRSETNSGLSNSRNLGFDNSTTEIIVPLDADDILPDFSLDLIYKAFEENNDIDFVAGDYYLKDVETNESQLIKCDDIATKNIIDKRKLSIHWKLLGTSPCRKSVWKEIGGYSLEFSYSVQDVDFWIRVLQAGFNGMYLNAPIYVWNRSAGGMNFNFDRFDMTKLLEKHLDFYQLSLTRKYIYNKIFESYYPYKDKNKILSLGKRYFYHLKMVNKLRFFYAITLSS